MNKRGQTVKVCIFLELFWLLVAIFSDSSSFRYVAVIVVNLMVVAAFVCREISLLPGAAPHSEDRNQK